MWIQIYDKHWFDQHGWKEKGSLVEITDSQHNALTNARSRFRVVSEKEVRELLGTTILQAEETPLPDSFTQDLEEEENG